MFAPNAAGLTSIRADVQNETEVIAASRGSYAVVNCISLYVERGRNTFHALHVEAAARLSGWYRKPRLFGWYIFRDRRRSGFVFALHRRARTRRTGCASGLSERNPDPPGCYVRTR